MQVRFWGTRGSLAKPGASTLRYGGNTACVEVRTASGKLIVLDCGTGLHGLGQSLLAGAPDPLAGHLLISHTHWDHIQGFPFFGPLFVPGSEWDIYAPGGLGQRLEETLAGQMEYTYFPVTLEALGATIRYHDLLEGHFDLEDVRITSRYLNHPALTLGYRLEVGGRSLAYVTDHEPHSRYDAEPGVVQQVHQEDQRHMRYIHGVDLLIHDAQYTLEEYPKKVGWGHSPAERVVDFALEAGVARLALFHHDPLRDDDALDQMVETCRARVAASGRPMEVFGAAEGLLIDLPERTAATTDGDIFGPSAVVAPDEAPVQTVLVVDDDPDVVELLSITLSGEGFRVLSAYDGERALEIARRDHPDLVLLDWRLPDHNGLEVTRTLRADADEHVREVPVVLLTAMTGARETAAAFEAGATDYLTKPFSPAHVRSRVRGWLLRMRTPTAD